MFKYVEPKVPIKNWVRNSIYIHAYQRNVGPETIICGIGKIINPTIRGFRTGTEIINLGQDIVLDFSNMGLVLDSNQFWKHYCLDLDLYSLGYQFKLRTYNWGPRYQNLGRHY